MDFVYTNKADAESDLKRFSDMFCNEDKPLYLIAMGGYQIRDRIGASIAEAVAVNGVLYRPENS